tara:strand:- start:83 stop:265 length:183 start_codon:yes stop_codon:yes gene_type:complete
MDKRKIQALINRLNDNIKLVKSVSAIEKGNSIQIAKDEGFIEGIEFVIKRLICLKESIDK